MVHREQALLAGLVRYVVDNLYVSSGPHNQVTNLPLFLRAFIDKPKREKNNDNDNRKEKRREDRAELNWGENWGGIRGHRAVRFISVHVAHIFWFLVRFSSVGFELLDLTYVIAIAEQQKQQQLTKRLQVARTF